MVALKVLPNNRVAKDIREFKIYDSTAAKTSQIVHI